MKKPYQKPVVDKREKLGAVAAQVMSVPNNN